jgi:hypothetical protein
MLGIIICLAGLLLVVNATYGLVTFVSRTYSEGSSLHGYETFSLGNENPLEIVAISLLGGLVFVAGCFIMAPKRKQ